MVDKSPHQILSPDKQEETDKEKLEEMLRGHSLDENIDLVYELIKEACVNDKEIDQCVETIVKEFEENKKEKEDEDSIEKYFR